MARVFEVTAMGDTMYFAAPNLDDANAQLTAICGELPADLVSWRELESLPDGAEYAADFRAGDDHG